MTATAAIPTKYRGVEYRSRLEARWGAFFHRIGWDATYEPFDGHGYIPDFAVNGDRPLLVEVKPALVASDFAVHIDKVTDGVRGVWNHDILIVGMTPLPPLGNEWCGEYPSAGILGELWPAAGDSPHPLDGCWQIGTGAWILCRRCHSFAVVHDTYSYASRPCGCYDGDGYLGHIGRLAIEQHWGEAANDVKWRGRDA